jgi:fibronectin type 3 domain-containing protein
MNVLTKIVLTATSTLLLFSGCAKMPGTPEKVKVDPTLERISINGYLTDMKAIAFEWKSISDERVKGIYVYRNDPGAVDKKKLVRVDTLKNRFSTHYVDSGVEPGTLYHYRFSTYNAQGAESKASKLAEVSTLPVLTSVSFFRSIGRMPRSAKLIWRPHTSLNVKGYRVERKDAGSDEWRVIEKIDGRLSAEFIDTDLKDNQRYEYRLRAVTFTGVVSTPSETVTVITKPLPKPVNGLKATEGKPKFITVRWTPSQKEGIDYYKLYRSDEPKDDFTYYAKVQKNSFTDKIEEDGEAFYYKVTAVDKDGLEGELIAVGAARGTTLAKPLTPANPKGAIKNKRTVLQWQKADKRTVGYVVRKTTRKSWIDKETKEFTGIRATRFSDADIEPDVGYTYEVIAVDKHGIRSIPSEPIELSFEAVK